MHHKSYWLGLNLCLVEILFLIATPELSAPTREPLICSFFRFSPKGLFIRPSQCTWQHEALSSPLLGQHGVIYGLYVLLVLMMVSILLKFKFLRLLPNIFCPRI
jgi:hypothetical protein